VPLLLLLGAAALAYLYVNANTTGLNVAPDRARFVARLRPIALAVERETGIRADLGIAQAAHESAYGSSRLALEAHNLFGFTAELGTYWRTQGRPFVEMFTREYIGGKWIETRRPFRRYGSDEESYRDWARLIQTKPYAEVLPHAMSGNLKSFAAALQKVGYATDPAYAAKIERVAREIA
jgi:peptidoglycan hydrolase FlgJ